MFSHVKSVLQSIEDITSQDTSRELVFDKLRYLSLSDFWEFLISLQNPDFPRLSKCLPRMASDEVQIAWTGTSGITLLTQTTDFARSMSYNFAKITGGTLEGKKYSTMAVVTVAFLE